jgi:hypothetical protein
MKGCVAGGLEPKRGLTGKLFFQKFRGATEERIGI